MHHTGFTAFLDLGFVEGLESVGINQIWKKKKPGRKLIQIFFFLSLFYNYR